MSNNCNILNVKPIKVNELGNYYSLNSDDQILIVQNNKSKFYSRKTTFSDFVSSITQLTSSLSGNIFGNFDGIFTGNTYGNLTGSISGSFKGKINKTYGSIIGIPFKTKNQKSISFEGTSSYSVSSSYSTTSSYSTNTKSSSFSLISNFVSGSYSNIPSTSINSVSSSYTLTSSLAYKSKFSINTYYADKSNLSNRAEYAYFGKQISTSSYAYFSKLNNTSSCAYTSSFSKTGSFSSKSITSSFSSVCKYANSFPRTKFKGVYFQQFPPDTSRFSDVTRIAKDKNLQYGTSNKWLRIELNNIANVCGFIEDGKLPADTRYIQVFFIFQNKEKQHDASAAWCVDSEDPTQPKIMIDFFDSDINSSGYLEDIKRSNSLILPIKPGNPPTFDILIRGKSGTAWYTTFKMYLQAYFVSQPCS